MIHVIRAIVVGLIVIGVAASVARSLYPGSLVSRAEPGRIALLRAVGGSDDLAADRSSVVAQFDRRFGDNPLTTYIHVLLGGVFLIAAPLQFSAVLRDRYRAFHRWSGRVLVTIGVVTALSGLLFGLMMPIAGNAERIVVSIFGGTVVAALARAVVLIRSGNVAGHRAWMIRAFAVMLGISTVRLVSGFLDLLLTPLGYSVEVVFVLSLWIGWGGTLLAGELWLRGKRLFARRAALSASAV